MKNHKILLLIFGAFLLSLALSSCESENDESQQIEASTSESGVNVQTEIAFPNKRGSIEKIMYEGVEIEVENIDGNYIFQGDILLTPDEVNSEFLASKSTGRLDRKWPNNTVYYQIAGSLPNKARVTNAIAHWQSKTNLKFVKRTNQTAYVYFQPGAGCSSFIGRTGWKQAINLAAGCTTGNTIHEIGHAIGLFHEHARADRNKYITIIYQNIVPGREHNFRTWRERGYNGRDLTSTLDYASIMMYGPKAFSKNGKPTIVRNDGRSYTTQRNGLSTNDIRGIRILYPPIATPPVTPPVTGAVPLYRYFNGKDHFYTTNFRELGNGANGMKLEKIECKIFSRKISGTVPLYRFFNRTSGDHLYKTQRNNIPGYVYEGVTGYIYSGRGSGRLPFYRYFNGLDHFYTTRKGELGGYRLEGVIGYVLPR